VSNSSGESQSSAQSAAVTTDLEEALFAAFDPYLKRTSTLRLSLRAAFDAAPVTSGPQIEIDVASAMTGFVIAGHDAGRGSSARWLYDWLQAEAPDLAVSNAESNARQNESFFLKGSPIVASRAMQERVLGYYGGQFASFNAVFSPKGQDGQPMSLFDVDTGRVDPAVAKAWQKYNISLVLRNNWKTLGPKLKGKIHILVGTADTFHLDEAVRLLDAELKKLGSDAKIEYVENKTHFDMYQDGLANRIAKEMYAVARPGAKAASR